MKKFLSLVLALTMTLSLVTISAGATDFEDDSEITYQEAITVIAGLGIVDGYTDGTFGPDEVLTRGAAAKIICNLILGPTTASVLTATSAPFSDVPVTNVFAGYITYCAQQGIISGYADGTFRPSGTLSGSAFMKMLLGALGYDSTAEGYTGSNWSISVIKQAMGIGLDDGNDNFLGSNQVTRQEACLYAFNTLQATMVEYSNSSTVVVDNVTVSTNSTRSDVENNSKTDGYIEDDGLMQFAEEYFPDLTAEDDTDDFGRPSTTWTYDGDDLGTYADDADDSVVLSAIDTLQTIVTDGDGLNYSTGDILSTADVYYNGNYEGEYSDLRTDTLGGKGDIVEVYENDDNDVDTIVFRSYTYAKVDEVDANLSSTNVNRGASVGLELVDIDDTSLGIYYDDYNTDSKILKGYNSSYTEGTVLAIALDDDGAILDSYVAEELTGTPSAGAAVTTATTTARNDTIVYSGSITLDGTKYTYAAKMTGVGVGENVDFDEEYTIYLTAEGYVLAVDGDSTAALDDVYYVAGIFSETTRGRTTYYLDAVSVSEGTYSELELSAEGVEQFDVYDSVDNDTGTILTSGSTYDTTVAGIYVLDEDDDEYFIDTDYCDISEGETYTDGRRDDEDTVGNYIVVVDANNNTTEVNRDSASIRFANSSAASRLYLTDSTFFVSVEGEADKESLSISTATGVMTLDATTNAANIYAFFKKNDSDAVFVVYAADELSGAVNMSDVVYLTDDATNATNDGYLVDLFFLDDMTLSEDATINDDSKRDQGFYTYDLDSDGLYELSSCTDYELDDSIEAGDDGNEDGYALDVVFNEVRNNRATGSNSDGVTFTTISFTDAVVIDTRTTSEKNSSVYSNDIESASALASAINRGEVTVDVFMDDGEIVFVAVKDVEAETDSDSVSIGNITGLEFSLKRTSDFVAGDKLTGLAEGDTIYVRAADGYSIDVDGTSLDLTETASTGVYSFVIEEDVTASDFSVTQEVDLEVTDAASSNANEITLTFEGTDGSYTADVIVYRSTSSVGYSRIGSSSGESLNVTSGSGDLTLDITGDNTEYSYQFKITVYDTEGTTVASFTTDGFTLTVHDT